MISSLTEHTRKCLKDSVSAKKVFKKNSCLCTFKPLITVSPHKILKVIYFNMDLGRVRTSVVVLKKCINTAISWIPVHPVRPLDKKTRDFTI
jgi:hypothetical protein